MSDEPKGLYKLGGAAFIISGILFLSRDVLEFMAGPPPSSGVQILAWVQSEHGSWPSARDSFPCVSDPMATASSPQGMDTAADVSSSSSVNVELLASGDRDEHTVSRIRRSGRGRCVGACGENDRQNESCAVRKSHRLPGHAVKTSRSARKSFQRLKRSNKLTRIALCAIAASVQ